MRTIRTMGIIGGAVAVLFAGTVAFAQERPAAAVRAENTAVKNMVENRRENASTTAASVRESARERVQAAREEAQAKVQAVRERAEQRLSDIQDKVKQQLAQKLATQFDRLNKTWTDHFSQLLDRYSAVLQKIQSRADAAAASGKDTSAVTAAIQSAETVLSSAQTAVAAQAAKTYTLDQTTVTTSTATTTPNGQSELVQKLRTAFQGLHNSLFADLTALRDGPMKAARAAVQSALQALGQIPGVDEERATTTANQ